MSSQSTHFCGSCGSDLPAGARFCAKCGSAVEGAAADTQSTSPDARPETGGGDHRRPRNRILGFAVMAVVALAAVGLVAIVVMSLGGSEDVLLLESDGFSGDVHVLQGSDQPTRESRLLRDVSLAGRSIRYEPDGYFEDFQLVVPFGGGWLFSYRTEGDEESTIAVMRDGAIEDLFSEDGEPTIYQSMEGEVFVRFSSSNGCELYFLADDGRPDRIGRGDWCGLTAARVGRFLISHESELTVVDSSGVLFEQDVAADSALTNDGRLLGVEARRDEEVIVWNVETGEVLDELRGSNVSLGTSNSVLAVGVQDDPGDPFEWSFYGGTETPYEVVVDEWMGRNSLGFRANIDGSHLLLGETSGDDAGNPDFTISIVDLDSGSQTEVFDGELHYYAWISGREYLIVDSRGTLYVGRIGEELVDIGEFSSEPGSIAVTFRPDSALVEARVEGNEELAVIDPSSRSLLALVDDLERVDAIDEWDDLIVVVGREDSDDAENVLGVVDLESGSIEVIDEGEIIGLVGSREGRLVYFKADWGDSGAPENWETLTVNPLSGERPDVLYSDATALFPDQGSRVPYR